MSHQMLENIIWPDWSHDPYPLYRVLRDEQPVFYDAKNNEYLLTRNEDVTTYLANKELFSNVPVEHLKPDFKESDRVSPLRENDPPQHTWLRSIVTPLFSPKLMRSYELYFDRLSIELLDAVDQKDVVDVSNDLAIPLPGRVTCDLLGVPLSEHKLFMDLTAERLMVLRHQYGHDVPAGRPIDQIRVDLWKVLRPVVESRKVDPKDDAITYLLRAQDEVGKEKLSDDVFIDMLLHLLTGGFHTTQHLIEMLVSLFSDRQDLWQRLREDKSLVTAAIEEMLRYDAPVQTASRRAVDECEIRGVTIPRNGRVKMVLGSANRDERAFDKPDEYWLDRSTKRHLAFATGIHLCPGAPVSRAEVKSLLVAMLTRYERIERLGPSQRWESGQGSVDALHGYKHVPVRLVRA